MKINKVMNLSFFFFCLFCSDYETESMYFAQSQSGMAILAAENYGSRPIPVMVISKVRV
jgi:hypothetical protein